MLKGTPEEEDEESHRKKQKSGSERKKKTEAKAVGEEKENKSANRQLHIKKGEIFMIPSCSPQLEETEDEDDYEFLHVIDNEDFYPLPERDQERATPITNFFLTHECDFDGEMERDHNIFDTIEEAALYTRVSSSKDDSNFGEIPHIVLWDYFGGNTCLDVNVLSGDTVHVLATEYQVFSMYYTKRRGRRVMDKKKIFFDYFKSKEPESPINFEDRPRQFLRGERLFALVRVSSLHSDRRGHFGVMPYSFLVEKSFFEEHKALYNNPPWYLGLVSTSEAKSYLMNPLQPPLLPGSFVIYSPRSLNIDPLAPRPYLLMYIDLKKDLEKITREVPREKERNWKKRRKRRKEPEEDSEDLKPLKEVEDPLQPIPLREFSTTPHLVQKIITITRDESGGFMVFDHRFETLYDLVFHLSLNRSQLPMKLILDALDSALCCPIWSCIPSPFSLTRDPLGLPMSMEQVAAAAYWTLTQQDQLKETVALSLKHTFNEENLIHQKLEKEIKKVPGRVKDRFSSEPVKSLVSTNPESAILSIDPNLIISPYKLSIDLDHELGKGQFGAVFQGDLKIERTHSKRVAVKRLKLIKNDMLGWLNELVVAQYVHHPNIVQFHGILIDSPFHSYVNLVFELVEGGSLFKYLQKCKPLVLTPNEACLYLGGVARGMAHLHSLEPSVIHGDLASRNVLLSRHPTDRTRWVPKVADFGLSKLSLPNLQSFYDNPHKIPFKWLPPEVHKRRELSQQTDIWSFGMLCCEVYEVGLEPFGCSSAALITPLSKDGYHLERPEKMPEFVWSVCLSTWRFHPSQRMPFANTDKPQSRHLVKQCYPYFTRPLSKAPRLCVSVMKRCIKPVTERRNVLSRVEAVLDINALDS